MPEVTDLQRVAQYVKSDKTAPSDVYNAACRMLDGASGRNAPISPTESAQNGLAGADGTRETHEALRDAQEVAQ
jgi:hypothetical protein